MEKEELFYENYSNPDSEEKKLQPKKRQHIKKDHRRKDRRKKQNIKPQVQQAVEEQQAIDEPNQNLNSLQSETSKYQRLEQFWRSDIDKFYRKQFTDDDKKLLLNVLNQKKPSILEAFKDKQSNIWTDKISLQYLYKYLNLIEQFSSQKYTFVLLEHQNKRQHYILVLDENKIIQKAVQVSQQQLHMLAYRQHCIEAFKAKKQIYNKQNNKRESLNQIQIEITCLVHFLRHTKQRLDQKILNIEERANMEPKFQPPAKVEQNYIAYLIKKNLKKALENQQIDYLNHFKKLDVTQHVSGLIDAKMITDKKDFDEYIRKRKLKKSGKKARWVLKTACGGCFSYFHQMYNTFSFCSQCHTRYHKYCYIPKNQGICQSCFLSKSNQTKRSRINQCQLCGIRGFLYLPMDDSNNAHIFCMLVNGLWKFQNTQIVFQKRHIKNAIQNQSCSICKQANSCIYKCECCSNHAHPLCAYLQGWNLTNQSSLDLQGQILKIQCCNGVERQKNQKKRKYVLNYKKCVFSQCQ